MSEPNRVFRRYVVTAQKPPRILIVNSALSLHEPHLQLLRSIPASVKTMPCCADMYRHDVLDYSLVILALHPKSREMPEAAHFARRRWNAARILLLEGECAEIDDWLYDERVGPPFNPAAIFDVAKRLMTEERYWIPA